MNFYLVGGSVRDVVMNVFSKDRDFVVTSAKYSLRGR